MLLIIGILGLCEVYDICVPEVVPEVNSLPPTSTEARFARQNSTSQVGIKDSNLLWSDLRKPLYILDRVCPEASQWVRDRYYHGKLVWPVNHDGYIAKFNYGTKQLFIYPLFFDENDGKKAAILAHEFRHSRQNITKLIRRAFAYAMLKQTQDWVVENDAYYFQQQVELAIFR